MYGNVRVSECLDNAIVVRRFWTVEKDVLGVPSNIGENDIRHHVSESAGVSLESC